MNKTHIATMGERFFMSKIAIATDSNSGITQAQGRELGIFVMPMPFYINDELFLEDITLSQEQFYQRLEEGADVKTTQPAPGDVLELWDRILKDYDELVYIPMSSGLSSSCETAVMLAQDYGGRVQVVNNQRISVTLRQSALDAQALAAAGRSAAEIKALLEQTKFDSDIYITVDTLKYLKKGGRCTPAAAAIGTVLNLKPVLRIKGEKLDSFAKARGWKAAKKTMLDTARRVMETDFAGCRGPEDLHIAAAFTGTREEAQEWLEELEAAHPELVTPDSPTQRVGGKVADGFQEVRHRIPLESLQDVFSVEELEEFDQRMQEALPEGVEYDVEPKVDGLSVALEYENGLFVRGATRGLSLIHI